MLKDVPRERIFYIDPDGLRDGFAVIGCLGGQQPERYKVVYNPVGENHWQNVQPVPLARPAPASAVRSTAVGIALPGGALQGSIHVEINSSSVPEPQGHRHIHAARWQCEPPQVRVS